MRARKHPHHANGGAARDWKVLSIRPPLRGALAFAVMPFNLQAARQTQDVS